MTTQTNKRKRRDDNDSDLEVFNAFVVRDAGPPFDSSSADLILRSSDNVDHRVHKTILSLASSVFASMFSLPTPPPSDPRELKDDLPIVPVSEKHRELALLLRFIYPYASPHLTDLSTILTVSDVAEKYAMDGLQETFRWAALECAAQAPVAAYAFGRQHNFGDLVVSAAQLSLETSIIDIPHSPELKRISGSELQELIGYHRRCQAEAGELALTPLVWSTELSQMPAASETRKCPTCQKMIYVIVEGRICCAKSAADWAPSLFYAPPWWYKFLQNASSALHARPVGREVTSPEIVAPALRQTNRKCQYATICSETEHTFLKAAESLAKKVDELTNKIAQEMFMETSMANI